MEMKTANVGNSGMQPLLKGWWLRPMQVLMTFFFQNLENVFMVCQVFLPLFFGPSSPDGPWLLALLYNAFLFKGHMNLSHHKGADCGTS